MNGIVATSQTSVDSCRMQWRRHPLAQTRSCATLDGGLTGRNSNPQGAAHQNGKPIKQGRSVLIHRGENVSRIFVRIVFWRPNQ